MGKYRLLKDTGIELIDITTKSKIQAFVPDYNDVLAYKKGHINENIFKILYRFKMRESYSLLYPEWLKLTEKPRIALACYCKAHGFCHRYLFKDMFIKHLIKLNLNYIDKGEIE